MQSVLGTYITRVTAHDKRLTIINQLITTGSFHYMTRDLLTCFVLLYLVANYIV